MNTLIIIFAFAVLVFAVLWLVAWMTRKARTDATMQDLRHEPIHYSASEIERQKVMLARYWELIDKAVKNRYLVDDERWEVERICEELSQVRGFEWEQKRDVR